VRVSAAFILRQSLKSFTVSMLKSCGVLSGENENAVELISISAQRTCMLGVALGELAEPGDVILLTGELGAGKTCLTQGIAQGLGIEDGVTSPSFVLLREHEGRLPLYHIDFYRLNTIEEMASLGLDDYLYGTGVCVIEWADQGMDVLPDEHLLVEIESLSATKRRLVFRPRGRRYVEMLAEFKSTRSTVRK